MTVAKRSAAFAAARFALLLSGWAVALGLGLRVRDNPPAVPVAVPGAEGKFARIFREWSADPKLDGALIGFCLLDGDGKTVFASPLAETALCPASALKTVTTGAAFAILGPEFRFETTLTATAPLDTEGGLAGDLVLVGGGDPTLTRKDLETLAQAAVAAGLKKVSGRLVADTSVFPPDPVNEHWNWGDIGNAYGAGAFGLNVDHNRLEIRFEPGAQPGAPATLLGGAPVARDTRWVNHIVTGPAGSGDQVVVYSEPYGRTITLRGSVPAAASGFTVSGAIPDPPALAVEVLRARLQDAGVVFVDQPAPPSTTRTTLATHRSAALPAIIDHLHEVSDNLEAQCLFLMIGKQQNAEPAAAIRAHWEKAGVKFVGLRLLDGSGLARANIIRPIDLARVNLAARRGPHGQRFYESLSAYAQGNVRGKIGGMSGVKTQTGFIRTAQGAELTFALLGNALAPGREFWQRLEDLLESVRAAHDQ